MKSGSRRMSFIENIMLKKALYRHSISRKKRLTKLFHNTEFRHISTNIHRKQMILDIIFVVTNDKTVFLFFSVPDQTDYVVELDPEFYGTGNLGFSKICIRTVAVPGKIIDVQPDLLEKLDKQEVFTFEKADRVRGFNHSSPSLRPTLLRNYGLYTFKSLCQ